LRRAIDDNSGLEYTKQIGKVWDGLTESARKTVRDAGNNLYGLSDQERRRWAEAVRPAYRLWVEEMNKRGLPGQKMLDDLLATTATYGRK
jgi:hypothetical protein